MKKGFPNHAVYCGNKFALHAISEYLREKVAKQNVRSLCPVIDIVPDAVKAEQLSHTTNDSTKDEYENWKQEGYSIRKSSPTQFYSTRVRLHSRSCIHCHQPREP